MATYETDIGQADGSSKKMTVNEHAALVAMLTSGKAPSADTAGIRICNEKYMFNKANQPPKDNVKYCVISKAGGGATVAMTKTALIVGVWDKNQKQGNDKNQNMGTNQMNIVALAERLAASGI